MQNFKWTYRIVYWTDSRQILQGCRIFSKSELDFRKSDVDLSYFGLFYILNFKLIVLHAQKELSEWIGFAERSQCKLLVYFWKSNVDFFYFGLFYIPNFKLIVLHAQKEFSEWIGFAERSQCKLLVYFWKSDVDFSILVFFIFQTSN